MITKNVDNKKMQLKINFENLNKISVKEEALKNKEMTNEEVEEVRNLFKGCVSKEIVCKKID